MARTKIFDVAYEIEGDDITIEQDAGCGEVHRITLHRIHLDQLARQAGLLNTPPSAIGNDLMSRHLTAIRDRALALYELLESTPIFPPRQEEPEDVELARKLYEAIEQLCTLEVNRESTTRRRFKAVVERLNTLASDAAILNEILDHCGSGREYITKRTALCDLANEYLRDLGLGTALAKDGKPS